ncbi:MAG: NAD-dependent epimerase/dehydratase family protein [Sphingomonas sp.]
MRVIIIGCGGFVGSHLLDRLLARDDVHVEGWDPETHKISQHLDHPRFTLHKVTCIDATELATLEEHLADADVLINLAAICNPSEYNTRPLEVIRSNLFDVIPIVDLCARANKWLMHFSTSEVYGRTLLSYLPDDAVENPDLFELREDSTPLIMGPVVNQRWTYACAKQMIERYIYAHHNSSGMPFTIIRPLNFFGPKMDYIPRRTDEGVPRVLACFMAALLNREPMRLVDGGNARRTIVAVEEAMAAVERALDRPAQARNRTFNIGNRANEVTMRELAFAMREVYADITGDESYRRHPVVDVSAEEFYGPGYEDCDRRMPDLSQAEQYLGWTPSRNLVEILLPAMRDYHDRYFSELAAEPGMTGRVPATGSGVPSAREGLTELSYAPASSSHS